MATVRPISGVTLPQSTNNDQVPADLNTMMDVLETELVLSFASASVRDAAITTPTRGQVVFLVNPGKHTKYDGSGWIDLGPRVVGTPVDLHNSSGFPFTPNGNGVVATQNITTTAPVSLLYVDAHAEIVTTAASAVAGYLDLYVDGAVALPGYTRRRFHNESLANQRADLAPSLWVPVTAGLHTVTLKFYNDNASTGNATVYNYDIYAAEIAP